MSHSKYIILENKKELDFDLKYYKVKKAKDFISVIIRTCEKGLLENLKYLIKNIDKKECLPNVLNRGLIEAIKNRQNSIIYFLLSLDIVNPRAINNKALKLAVKTQNNQLVRFLLEHKKVDISASNFNVFIYILKKNNLELFYFILNKAKKSQLCSIMSVVFSTCCEIKNKDFIKTAISHPSFSFCLDCSKALSLLIRKNEINFIDFVLSKLNSSQIMKEKISLFIRISCEENNFDLYKIFVNKYNGYPCGRQSNNLRKIIKNNNTEFALYMINQGIFNLSNKNNYALKTALSNRNTIIVNRLLQEKSVLEGINKDFFNSLEEEELFFLKLTKNLINF